MYQSNHIAFFYVVTKWGGGGGGGGGRSRLVCKIKVMEVLVAPFRLMC